MKRYIITTLVFAGVLLIIAGCKAVGPDYDGVRWRAPILDDLPDQSGDSVTMREVVQWWQVFDDSELIILVEQALTNNLTLAGALSQLREARARLGISHAGLLPEIDVNGAWNRFRRSDNAGMPGKDNNYRAGFDARWEIDIFGRRRRSIEAAQADFEAACATYENVWVVVAAETANAYLTFQELRKRLDVARSNLDIQEGTLDILKSRAEAGIGDRLAVEQARYNMEQTKASIPALQSGITEALNALAVLVGVMPGKLALEHTNHEKILTAPLKTLVDIPADALRKRPDIRAAERRLAARCASIGVAEADLYPTFALGGSLGLEALNSGDFLDPSSRFYSWGPTIIWPVFSGGSIRANIEMQKARYDQAFFDYEKSVLSAAAELRDKLSAYVYEYQRLKALREATDAAREAVEISQDQYRQGLADFTSVLDAQRSLLSFEELVVVSRATIARNLIGVYKALGGGWPQSE
jgi:NodT family efflux transporter outer membrane factor (OMF) lipoprotein